MDLQGGEKAPAGTAWQFTEGSEPIPCPLGHQGGQHMPQMAQLVAFMRSQVCGAAPAAARA